MADSPLKQNLDNYRVCDPLIKRRLWIVILAAFFTCVTVLFLPLTEELMEFNQQKLEKRQVNTITWQESQPPQQKQNAQSQNKQTEKDEQKEHTVKPPPEKPAQPDLPVKANSQLKLESLPVKTDFEMEFSVKTVSQNTPRTQSSTEGALKPSAFSEGALDRAPTPLSQTQPSYPFSARTKGLEGYVNVEIVVNKNGKVEQAKAVNAEPTDVFNKAALRAVKNWTFRPGRKNNKPVRSRVKVKIRFRLQK